MNISIVRQFWSVVEDTQAQTLLSLNETDLVDRLLGELQHQKTLTAEEYNCLCTYICVRIALIRDLAQSRLEEEI